MSVDSLIDLDRKITLAINSLNSPATDQFWMVMSDRFVWVPAYGMVIVMLFYRLGWKRAITVLASILLTLVLCDQISDVFKNGIERLRPCYDAVMIENGLHYPELRKGFFGFFSGHAANAFGAIMCTLMGFRNDSTHSYDTFSIGGIIWAGLISTSRIMMGKHFFGDVLVGCIFGCLVGYAMGSLAKVVIRRWITTAE